MRSRIEPGNRRQIGIAATVFSGLAGKVMQTSPPAVFTTLARTRRVFWGWLLFSGALMPFGHLSRRESEMVILRVAHLAGSDYEKAHHERLGRRAGLTPTEINSLTGGDPVAFNPREEAMLGAISCLHSDGDVDDVTWKELRRHLDERESIELLMLVAQYQGLAQTLHVLRVPVDPAKG